MSALPAGTQDLTELGLRGAKFRSARCDGVLQCGAVIVEQLMNTPGLEHVPDAQEYFNVIQRFVQEIGRAKIQGPKFGLLIHIGGEDNDWKKNFGPIAGERYSA